MPRFSGMMMASSVAATAAMTCPGSKAWITHAKTQVTAVVKASCADVNAEIQARAGAQQGWVDPHNGGIYSVLSSTATEVRTERTANPSHSAGGKKYVDKQVFTLSDNAGACEISACSESQSTSYKDFSTNYCDLRNLYCGSADGCTPVARDFSSTQETVKASSGQSDFSACIVKQAPIKSVASKPNGPCCKACPDGKEKYYSVPSPTDPKPQCGEFCAKPSMYPLWKLFEPKLLKGDCATQGFTKYTSTETDGVWPLACTNDRYVKPADTIV